MAKNTPSVAPLNRVQRHSGGCHCGAIRFEVSVDTSHGSRCNCSICNKVGQLGAIVKPEAFTLLAGTDSITEYAWGMKIGQRSFCKHCGVHCFGRGHLAQLGGDYVSVNFNALDNVDPLDVTVTHWDGRHDNWQAGPRSAPWPIVAPETSAA
jgi:hypothetical protein